MKIIVRGAMLACAILGHHAAAQPAAPASAVAAPKAASLWVARVLERYRYQPEGQAAGTGARPFDRFIEALDGDRMVFTEADLSAMAAQRDRLDRLTDERQMDIPAQIFAAYLQRSVTLYAYAQELLRQPPDFTGHQRYQRVRASAAREADESALRGLWRRRVMHDYLDLRLAGSTDAQIVATLQQRYARNLARVQAMPGSEVAGLFLNAYAGYLDPHGNYLGPESAAPGRVLADLAGTGMLLQKQEDLVTVLEVVRGGPAERSGGLGAGDRIVGIAENSGQAMTQVIGWTVDDVVARLRGPAGSAVTLDILPYGSAPGSAARRVTVVRATIRLDDQRASGRIEELRRGAVAYRIGIIAVPVFYQDFAARKAGRKDYLSVTRDVALALEQMKRQNADAILLDMRSNGGGSLIEAVDLAGLFLPGAAIAQQVMNERKVSVEMAPQGVPAWDGPLAILLDRRSAAGTEIVAAALQDYGRGLVLGDLSYGRGSVQTIINLNRFAPDAATSFGELKLTIAALCRAGGRQIQGSGVTPDILVPGRIDLTGKANADPFASAACKVQDIPRQAGLDALLPALASLHDGRMRADRSYQAHLSRRARDEALLSGDEVSLNEAERRTMPDARPAGDLATLQLNEALQILGDAVQQLRAPAGK